MAHKVLFTVLVLAAFYLVTALEEEASDNHSFQPLNDNINGFIAGGYNAREGEFPYQVHLKIYYLDGSTAICGGSIINQNWILTAAHCVKDENNRFPNMVQISAGGINRDEQPIKLAGNLVVVHSQYRKVEKPVGYLRSIDNDIAMIRVSSNLIHPPYTSAVKLPSSDQNILGQIVVASGFGRTELNLPSEVLKAVNMKIYEDNVCSKRFGTTYKVDQMFCAGGVQSENHGTCRGDSGGPIVLKEQNIIVGLTSFGGACGTLGANTKVPNYLDFIQRVMRQYG